MHGLKHVTRAACLLFCFTVMSCEAMSDGTFQMRLNFEVDQQVRRGVLSLPTASSQSLKACVLFVHGDGDSNSYADGYYEPIWEELASRGIASYSWDKPGVDFSEGNWLHQSMDDRAYEVLAAYEMLTSNSELNCPSVGVIGFSQATWVVPKVLVKEHDIDFAVFISTPINWLAQSQYLTVIRLHSEGYDEAFITRRLEFEALLNEQIMAGMSYDDFLVYEQSVVPKEHRSTPVGRDRYGFIQKNIGSDSTEDLLDITQPILLMLGEQDVNIDAQRSLEQYKEIFKSRASQFSYRMYPNTEHSMLKADEFLPIRSPYWFWLKMVLMGRDGFHPAFLNDLGDWVEQQANKQPR